DRRPARALGRGADAPGGRSRLLDVRAVGRADGAAAAHVHRGDRAGRQGARGGGACAARLIRGVANIPRRRRRVTPGVMLRRSRSISAPRTTRPPEPRFLALLGMTPPWGTTFYELAVDLGPDLATICWNGHSRMRRSR